MAEATCISIPVDTDRNTPQSSEWSSPEFGAIYREHAQPIYYLALRILGEPAEAQDATHDVFLKASTHLRESGVHTESAGANTMPSRGW